MSLRTKLLVFAAALVLVPGAIYGIATVSQSRAALERVVGRQLLEGARNAADRLATTLRSEERRLESFALQDVMREIRIGDLDKRISSFLASVKRGCPACVDLAVLDVEGRVVASSNPVWIEGRERPPLGDGRAAAVIEGPLAAGSGKPSVLRLTVPVQDPESAPTRLGRLVALLEWQGVTAVIAGVRQSLGSVGLDADVLIVDRAGRVIGGAPRPDGPWQPEATVPPLSKDVDVSSAAFVDEEASMLLGAARLPADLPAWRIVVAQPLAEALAPVDRMARFLGIALGATLCAALGVAFFAARRVTQPLGELTAAVESVGRRDPAAPVALRSRDEIGRLTDAFNRMSVDLRRAERELVEAAKFAFVGELAAGVAHEVRTPLGVLRSSAQLLERSLEAKDEEARELLQMLREEVDRIERVVSGLLELGRPRELRRESSPLGPIVFRAADFVEAQAREKGVRLRRHAALHEPSAFCDPELVYQVALNLLVNAVQIVPRGGAVDVGCLCANGGYAGFEVRDDGPGMTEDVRARVFEPFFTRREGGAGLGLTFVQRVVQEHRGRITVESAPGRGSAFRVELPVSPDLPGSGGAA